MSGDVWWGEGTDRMQDKAKVCGVGFLSPTLLYFVCVLFKSANPFIGVMPPSLNAPIRGVKIRRKN